MAIYSLRMSVISRSKGRSATAAAAYRSGEKIYDERTGETHDYTRKGSIYSSEIIAPKNTPDWVQDRSKLWNKVERVERRKDSQLAREVTIALPVELSPTQRQELTREYVQAQFVDQGMVADVAYHDFETNNPHTHVMLTMRHIDEKGFGKKNRNWNQRQRLEHQREAWAEYANRALKQVECDQKIDHRSLEDQGIDRVPQIHLGAKVLEMEARGIRTRVGDESRRISNINRQLKYLELERQKAVQEIKTELTSEQAKEREASTQPTPPIREKSRGFDLER
ncbi:MAG: MobQ family relaxase [Cyanobacteria bacterium P01_G01_bin.38]